MATKLPYVVPSTEWVKWNALKEKHKNIIIFLIFENKCYSRKTNENERYSVKTPQMV